MDGSFRPRSSELPEDGSIDAGLYVLDQLTEPGVEWTLEEIAIACGCKKQNIAYIEQKALKKLRQILEGTYKMESQGQPRPRQKHRVPINHERRGRRPEPARVRITKDLGRTRAERRAANSALVHQRAAVE